jgi:hypothetical protein
VNTPAHDQKLTIRLVEHIPPHGPRGKAFEAAKRRMRELGLYRCAIQGCDTGAQLEAHHSIVEHAWAGVGPDGHPYGVDVDKLNAAFGLHLSDADFAAWAQSPGNLEILCAVHHRTQLGIHALPEPLWNLVRIWRDDVAPPAEHV